MPVTSNWYTEVMDTNEIWALIPSLKGYYEASDQGSIRSTGKTRVRSDGVRFTPRPRVIRPSKSKKGGYFRFIAYIPGEDPRTVLVSRAVLEAFKGASSDSHALHNNGVTSDNRLVNLRWGTPSENMLDKRLHGTDHNRVKSACPRGHVLKQPNLKTHSMNRGFRACKACHQADSDYRNGSVLSKKQLSDMRYFMILEGLSFKHGTRRDLEVEMWERSIH